MATIASLNSRLDRLEAALNPSGLVVLLLRFGKPELLGISCPSGMVPYVERKAGESEESLCERACAEAEKRGGLIVLIEDRGHKR